MPQSGTWMEFESCLPPLVRGIAAGRLAIPGEWARHNACIQSQWHTGIGRGTSPARLSTFAFRQSAMS